MREIVINTRSQNRKLAQENEALRRQNFKLRAAVMHFCRDCPEAAACPELPQMKELLNA